MWGMMAVDQDLNFQSVLFSHTKYNTRLTPHMKIIVWCSCHDGLLRIVTHIPIWVMLKDESGWIEPKTRSSVFEKSLNKGWMADFFNSPIVKNLTTHNMPSYTPAIFITLVAKPIMTQDLSVEIVSFKGCMVDMGLGSLKEEETMMVHQLFPSCKTIKGNNVLPFWIVSKLHHLSVSWLHARLAYQKR